MRPRGDNSPSTETPPETRPFKKPGNAMLGLIGARERELHTMTA